MVATASWACGLAIGLLVTCTELPACLSGEEEVNFCSTDFNGISCTTGLLVNRTCPPFSNGWVTVGSSFAITGEENAISVPGAVATSRLSGELAKTFVGTPLIFMALPFSGEELTADDNTGIAKGAAGIFSAGNVAGDNDGGTATGAKISAGVVPFGTDTDEEIVAAEGIVS